MNLRLAANEHAWLIVPDCIVASRAALDRYGALQFVGEFDQAELGARELARITTEFDASSFARISRRLARRLTHSMGGAAA